MDKKLLQRGFKTKDVDRSDANRGMKSQYMRSSNSQFTSSRDLRQAELSAFIGQLVRLACERRSLLCSLALSIAVLASPLCPLEEAGDH
jgi:hypothetical protein